MAAAKKPKEPELRSDTQSPRERGIQVKDPVTGQPAAKPEEGKARPRKKGKRVHPGSKVKYRGDPERFTPEHGGKTEVPKK